MATVYRGEHVSGIGMTAAIKKLHPHLALDEELRARLKIEAQALARLKHRNIVQLFDYVDVDGNCALVTELVEGRTLRAVMGEFTDWPMPLSLALLLFRQVLEGVGHAHRNNCLHRDLKPGNIMVTSENEVKVLDFGIANLIDTERLTSTGISIGTPVYMAPEQLEGRQDLDQRADLYSLGMTFWEMLAGAGARPIGERGWRLTESHLGALLDRQVPASLVEVVRCLVQHDRENRYTSCDEVLEALALVVDEGCLDEESRLALAGVGPATPSSELPTFEFESTRPAATTGPVTQTIRGGTEVLPTTSSAASSNPSVLLLVFVVAVLCFALWILWSGSVKVTTEADQQSSEPDSAQEVGLITATLPLSLRSDPPGAVLTLDGEELGDQAVTRTVPAREADYELSARLNGYRQATSVCSIGAEAIARGSASCTVALQKVIVTKRRRATKRRRKTHDATSVDNSSPSSKPTGTQSDGTDAKALDADSEAVKPKIHKID